MRFPDNYFVLDQRGEDNLPVHIRRNAYWAEDTLGAGYWIRLANGKELAVEFEHEPNLWYPLYFSGGNTWSHKDLAFNRQEAIGLELRHLAEGEEFRL